MSDPRRIYLDNAATSWPKPESVYAAVDGYLRQSGAPAGRSTYREAAEVERQIARTRADLAALLHVEDADHIVFTFNGTDSLNMAIHGLLRPGDHVVTTVVEHNSVLRPLRTLESRGLIQVTRISCDDLGVVDPQAFEHAIRPATRLFALIHASNVTGAVQPVEAVGHIAAQHGIAFLLDAAQTLGHLPVFPQAWHVDLLAAPGHKGLLGPLGSGILYIAPGIESRMQTIRQGGTGTRSQWDEQPPSMPDRFESGNASVPAILGLGAGVRFLQGHGIDQVQQHDRQLVTRLLEGLSQLKGVTVHGPRDSQHRVGVVSISLDGYDPQEVAVSLDLACRVQVRAGLHCAPRMHQALGTVRRGGTVRFSVGVFNCEEDVDIAVESLRQLIASS